MAMENPVRAKGFFTPQPSPSPSHYRRGDYPHSADRFHIIYKVPAGDSPYVRAKHAQLVDKDPSKAVSLFWAAINSGDRVDSALKDMAIVMKQLDRSDEAIEAIRSFRHLSPADSQESLDNILIELYKRSGRIEEEIELLEYKIKNIEEGIAFGGRKKKTARSQGKKIEITLEKEYSRLLGNLAWAHMHLKNYKLAEENYRKALSVEQDRNKQCNLAICLMRMNKMSEAKFLLQSVRASSDIRDMDESSNKSLERAMEVLAEIESQKTDKTLQCEPLQPSNADKAKIESVSCWRKYGHQESGSRYKKTFSAVGSPMPFTQPRRCAWPFNNGYQDRGCSRASRKLSFDQQFSNNRFVPGPDNEKQKSLSDSGHWRNVSSKNFYAMRNQPTLLKIPDGKWRRDSIQNNKKSVDSISVTSEPSNLEFSREQDNQNSEVYTSEHFLGSERSYIQLSVDEKQPTLASQRKKSWADLVEEDDGLATQPFGRESFDKFNDENDNCNITHETPSLKNQTDNLSQCYESLDLNCGYYTQPEKAMKQHKRSTDRTETGLSSTFHGQLNFDIPTPVSLMPKKRLQVFRDITP